MRDIIKKIIKNVYTRILFFLIILSYIYYNIDKNEFLQKFQLIEIDTLFIILLFQIFNPLLYSLKWYCLIKNFYFRSFKYLNSKIATGLIIQELLQSSYVMDIYKFVYLENITKIEKLQLIINEKFITISVRLSLVLILLTIANILFFKKFLYFNFFILFIFSIILILIYIIFKGKFFSRKFAFLYNYKEKFFSKFVVNRKRILLIEITRNFILLISYFVVLSNFLDLKSSIILSLLGPLIEIIIKILQHIPTFGYREIIFFFLGKYTVYDENILLVVSISVSFAIFISILFNYTINTFIKFFNNNE